MVKIRKKLMAISAAVMLGGMLSGVMQTGCKIYADNLKLESTVLENVTDDNIVLTAEDKAVTNGWVTNDDGSKSYYQNGERVESKMLQIDGAYYYFNSKGRMLQDSQGYVSGSPKSGYIRAKSNGKLYCNEWYKDEEYGYKRYYGADCYHILGLNMIDGAYYYFYSGGQMLQDSYIYISDSDTGKSGYVRAKSNGKLYCNEWYSTGHYWYYYGRYCFGLSGFNTIAGQTYYFRNNGEMRTNALISDGTDLYYIGKDGIAKKAARGWLECSGYWYYVTGSSYAKSEIVWIDGEYYYFDSNGHMLKGESAYIYGKRRYVRAKSDGKLYCGEWFSSGGDWYYYGADCYSLSGLNTVSGKSYYFASSGCMYTDTVISNTNWVYFIDSDGIVTAKRIVYGWNEYNGNKYYMTGNSYVKSEIKKIDGVYYYFDSNGRMLDDAAHYRLRAKSGGKLCCNEWYKDCLGDWYYYGEDFYALSGLNTVNGKVYYFDSNGKMLVNSYVSDNGVVYKTDANGIASKYTKKGWLLEDYNWCYIQADGKLAQGLTKIDSDWYYFNYLGYLVTGKIYVDGAYYFFDEDGKMSTDAWIHYENSYLYATESGKLATGDITINGKEYTFDSEGIMLAGVVISSAGKEYYYNTDGSCWGEIKQYGWNYKDGCWYYITKNGMYHSTYTYENKIFKLPDGYSYAFDYYGRMLSSGMYGNIDGYYGCVYASETGQLQGGWIKIDGIYYYADPDTKCINYDGFKEISGKTYYFSGGRMLTGTIKSGSTLYYLGTNGVLLGKEKIGNGWTYIDGDVYYYKNGEAYTGWVGNYYVSYGEMQRDTVITKNDKKYALDKYGKWISKKGWTEIGSSWYYIGSGGTVLCNQWIKVNNKWYYAGSSGAIYSNGRVLIDDKYEIFDEDGVWQGTLGDDNKYGWIKKNGDWYYRDTSGSFACYATEINGKYYYFDYDTRKMMTNYSDGYYYYGSDGVRKDYTGWKKIAGYWCYFNSAHEMVSGWLNDNGKWYYLDTKYVSGVGVLYVMKSAESMYAKESGRIVKYTFNAAGELTGTKYNVSGWIHFNVNGQGEWAYVKNGECLTGYNIIDGKAYIFDAYGYMYSNTCVDKYVGIEDGYYVYRWYYVNSDGVVVTASGWYKLGDGTDVYVDNNGFAVEGIVKWKGKDYISIG